MKRTCHLVDFADPADHRVKKRRKKKRNRKDRQILGSYQSAIKAVVYEVDSDYICIWWT